MAHIWAPQDLSVPHPQQAKSGDYAFEGPGGNPVSCAGKAHVNGFFTPAAPGPQGTLCHPWPRSTGSLPSLPAR